MRRGLYFFVLLVLLLVATRVEAAHFIVGIAEPALDGTLSDGKTVVLWNPANGLNDNLTDIVGPTGNSGASTIYLIDCELLTDPCVVGDEMRVRIVDAGDGYTSDFENLTVTGAGFDVMANLTLNTPPQVFVTLVDDSFSVPLGEVDLTPLANTTVICNGTLVDLDGNETLETAEGELFLSGTSFFGDSDDNNYHYSNGSCFIDLGYGSETEAYFACGFSVAYYANAGGWNCTVRASDNLNATRFGSNTTSVNELIALSVPGILDFGTVDAGDVSFEVLHNVTNAGNVMINVSLSGYARTVGDGYAMNCTTGTNLSVGYVKYNVTASNPGTLVLSSFEGGNYTNLTSAVQTRRFNLPSRLNDAFAGIDDTNTTYWRTYVPTGVAGNCIGNVIFGAIRAPAS